MRTPLLTHDLEEVLNPALCQLPYLSRRDTDVHSCHSAERAASCNILSTRWREDRHALCAQGLAVITAVGTHEKTGHELC